MSNVFIECFAFSKDNVHAFNNNKLDHMSELSNPRSEPTSVSFKLIFNSKARHDLVNVEVWSRLEAYSESTLI